MLTKDDGMLSIIDMAISLVEVVIKMIEGILSGDFSAVTDVLGKLTG